MRGLLLIAVALLVASCASGAAKREQLGRKIDGAYYNSGSFAGGVGIYVSPSGTVQYRPSFGKTITFIDTALWKRLVAIVQDGGGVDTIDDLSSEGAICDGGWIIIHVKVGEMTAHYHVENDNCGDVIDRSDKAGRQIFEILVAISKQIESRHDK